MSSPSSDNDYPHPPPPTPEKDCTTPESSPVISPFLSPGVPAPPPPTPAGGSTPLVKKYKKVLEFNSTTATMGSSSKPALIPRSPMAPLLASELRCLQANARKASEAGRNVAMDGRSSTIGDEDDGNDAKHKESKGDDNDKTTAGN